MKLHLGCGNKKIDGFINIDIRYLPNVDDIDNIKYLRKYKPNSIDEIYSSHTLEHFGRWEYKQVLIRWYELLKPDGVLRLAVPNFESICEYYTKTKDLKSLIGLLYGGQDYTENYHYNTFDFNSLKEDLTNIGFYDIKLWDNKEILIDDYSKSYLPHMDNTNGQLMSLNIISKKKIIFNYE